jgi:hypothetical protein
MGDVLSRREREREREKEREGKQEELSQSGMRPFSTFSMS